LQALVRRFDHVRVLQWRGFQPGAFGGYTRIDDAREFDGMIGRLLGGIGW
jgi:hypothetical protein